MTNSGTNLDTSVQTANDRFSSIATDVLNNSKEINELQAKFQKFVKLISILSQLANTRL